MMNRLLSRSVRAACTGLGVAALASCATLNREGSVGPPMDGGSVAVRQGSPLVINLSAATAGYGWVLASDPGKSVWLIGGPDYTPDPIPPGTMGYGGTTTFRFRALDPGSVKLEFAYRLLQDGGVPPSKVVSYDITVNSSGWQNWF